MDFLGSWFKAGACRLEGLGIGEPSCSLGPATLVLVGSTGSKGPVSTSGLPKGLVETCLTLSKMPLTLRHCCITVTLCQTPFFLMETRSMRNFSWGCHWHAGTPWPHVGQLGEPHSVVRTRKERADGPILAGCEGENACKNLSCTNVLTRPGWDASPYLLEAASSHSSGAKSPSREGRGAWHARAFP